ncbi:hypothetical protein [Aeromicrobium sp. IC_218]|uniref:hypothetical protein n=1 Tax=Aeromicrobium sp. IC_218 TaxID=2545468 RepID=UPI001040004E|nr:hypothetical protein [Aeromicrobium sp. IC_218]TCI96322.1 hypothetical protein E0W78_15135 [Aeromicrobium sp. IC_218]
MDEVDERRARNTVRWSSMLVDNLLQLEPGDPDAVHVARDLVSARHEVDELQAAHPSAPWAPTAVGLLSTAAGRAEAILRSRHGLTDADLDRLGLLPLVDAGVPAAGNEA